MRARKGETKHSLNIFDGDGFDRDPPVYWATMFAGTDELVIHQIYDSPMDAEFDCPFDDMADFVPVHLVRVETEAERTVIGLDERRPAVAPPSDPDDRGRLN